jgi:hypothetical protein
MSGGLAYNFHSKNPFTNDCFSLGSTMTTSQQQSCVGSNNFKLFFDDYNRTIEM